MHRKRHPFFCSFLIGEWWVQSCFKDMKSRHQAIQSFQQDHRIRAKAWKTWKPRCWFMVNTFLWQPYLRLNGWFWQEVRSFFNGHKMFFLFSRKLKYQWVHFSFLFDLFLAEHTDFKATDALTMTTLKKNKASANHYHKAFWGFWDNVQFVPAQSNDTQSVPDRNRRVIAVFCLLCPKIVGKICHTDFSKFVF